jgi:hypothetical protein
MYHTIYSLVWLCKLARAYKVNHEHLSVLVESLRRLEAGVCRCALWGAIEARPKPNTTDIEMDTDTGM